MTVGECEKEILRTPFSRTVRDHPKWHVQQFPFYRLAVVNNCNKDSKTKT